MHRITDSGATEFIDVENGDLKLIIAALAPLDPPTFDGYGVWAAVRKRQSALRCEPPLNVPCVRIHCNGEVTRSRWPHYAQAFIPSWDVPRSEVILQISSRIGLPLYAKQERLDPAKWSDLDRESMNSVVLGLFLELDPSVPYWGTIPNRWFAHTGNVLLARQDGEDLSVEDAERVCKFAQDVIGPLVIAARELGCPPGSKEELLASITPEKFAEFCETYEIEAVADRLKRKRESSKRYRAAKIAEKARAGAEQDARLLASEDIDTEGTDVKREEGVKEEEDVEQMQKFEEEDDAEQVKEQAEREIVIKPEPTD